ncbi:hypothetical protein BH10PSE4_BH10PSE4_07750 [soil metagenome]
MSQGGQADDSGSRFHISKIIELCDMAKTFRGVWKYEYVARA